MWVKVEVWLYITGRDKTARMGGWVYLILRGALDPSRFLQNRCIQWMPVNSILLAPGKYTD